MSGQLAPPSLADVRLQLANYMEIPQNFFRPKRLQAGEEVREISCVIIHTGLYGGKGLQGFCKDTYV